MSNLKFTIRHRCPVCSSDHSQQLYEAKYDTPPISDYLVQCYQKVGKIEIEYLIDASYILNSCNECGLIYQKWIPDNTLMERLYESWIDPMVTFKNHLDRDDLDYYSSYAQEIMQVISYFSTVPAKLDFFDYGMGWGRWALLAKGFGCNSFGLEFSTKRVEFARKNGINVVSWEELPSYKFDYINTEQVFEHIANPMEILKNLKNSLKPGGIIKISVPNALNIRKRLKKMDWNAPVGSKYSLNPVSPLEHINFFQRQTIIKMADLADMEEILIPIKKQYQYTTNWRGLRNTAINIVLPIYRNVLKRMNYVFLRNVS
jgi:2-polyprenyl-3-methyl-5-hydroxy-6-metoxy-1,4-benzoquinol methylase